MRDSRNRVLDTSALRIKWLQIKAVCDGRAGEGLPHQKQRPRAGSAHVQRLIRVMTQPRSGLWRHLQDRNESTLVKRWLRKREQ